MILKLKFQNPYKRDVCVYLYVGNPTTPGEIDVAGWNLAWW